MEVKRWWRVAFAIDGSLLSAVPVTEASADEPRVFYVYVEDDDHGGPELAVKMASALAAQEKYRRGMYARRAIYEKEGRCRCGRKPEPGFKTCPACQEKGRASHERAEKRAAGEVVPVPDKSESYRERREEEAREVRKATLREVRRVVGESRSLAQVQAWVTDELVKLEARSRRGRPGSA